MGIFACALIIGAASFATAGVPDLGLSTATTYVGANVPVMLNLPNGGGSPFTSATINLGGTATAVDATINLTLLDGGMVPVVNFPFEDLWLESLDGGMVFCTGGTVADANTDAAGQTTWTFPLRASGASQALTQVMVNGAALTSSAGLALSHNSPDINADGNVNLTDVPLFAADFYGGLDPFRSDFQYDGAVNLSDVVKLAQGIGAQCP